MAVAARVMLLLVISLAVANALPKYISELPNVPTWQNVRWNGVGHVTAKGGGDRNSFGKDFAMAGRKWTPELCKKDSDGDGFTNGQELGDPDCKWSKGQGNPAAASGRVISHPGVKESKPVN